MKPDLTPISRFPDLEKPERERLNQLLRLLILTTRGDLLTRGATYLKRLVLGTAGKVLHSDGTDVEWAVLQANEVEVERLSGADYDDVQDYINFFGNRTLLSGGTISSEGDGDAAMASCTAWCKITDGDTAVGKFFNFAGVGNITLTDLVTNFIYLDYNGGTPQVVVATSVLTHGFKQDHIFVAAVYRSGTTLHIHQSGNLGIEGVNRAHLHHLEEFYVHRASGMVTSSVGTRQLSVDTGVLYAGLNRNTTNAFNTSTGDTFSYWYYDGDLGTPAWVEVAAQDAIDSANYNDVDTGLVAHSAAAKRGVHWVYMDNDGVHLHVVYGQDDYSTAQAELATVPSSLPPIVTGYCTLIAKIIVQKDQDTLFISYPWTEAFKTSLATDHGSLAGLGDDDHTQYLLKTLYDAQSVIIALTDNNPVRLTIGIKKVLGRIATGDIHPLDGADLWTILTGTSAIAVSLNDQKLTEILAISELDSAELTIDTDGAVVAGRMFHTIDTENDDATDDLVTISNTAKIAFTFIRPNNDARTIIVKHDTGNIWLQGKTDISLDDIEDGLLLAWDDDNAKWFDISIGAGAPPGAHKDSHDPEDGSDKLDTAAPSELAGVQAAGEGSSHSFARADHAHQIQASIADDHLVTVDGDPGVNEHGVFTATGLAGLTDAELLAALSGDAGAAFDWNDNILQKVKGLLLTAATELTMDTNGAITVTQMVHTVDTFEDAASDDLVTINGGTTVGLIVIRPAHADRTVVVKDGGGNIELLGGADITLDDITDHVMLFWDTTNSKWVDVGGGGGDGGLTDVVDDATPQLGGALDVNEKFIGDGDNDTGWDLEQAADEDIIRGKTAGTECFHLSAAGMLTLAKQSVFRAYLTNGSAVQKIRDVKYAYLMLDSEAYDVQNEHDNAVDIGTDDAGTAFKLSETGAFTEAESYYVGKWVWNTTDDWYAKITAKDSINVLSIDANIMTVTDTYKIYSPYWTCTEDGKYLVVSTGLVQDPALADGDYVIIYISQNDVVKYSNVFRASTTQGIYESAVTVVNCAADDTILTKFYQNNAANTTRGIWYGENYSSMTILKMA